MPRIKCYTDDKLINAVKISKSCAEVLRILGLNHLAGGNISNIKKDISRLNLDTTHFSGQGHNRGKKYVRDSTDINQYLVENSTYQTNKLKRLLLLKGYFEEECEKCLRSEWEGEKIPLELHHINGKNNDHRLENLQILCPNCHALTDTYRGKNIKTMIE